MAITFHPDGRITGATIQADVSGQLTNTGSGQILETIAATCDGRTVTVPSGSYTITNVTASQTGAATYADCNGSVINYTPPAGTKQLVYRYQFQWNCTALSGLSTDVSTFFENSVLFFSKTKSVKVPPISIANLIEKPYLFIQNHNNKNQVISESYIVLVQLQFQER